MTKLGISGRNNDDLRDAPWYVRAARFFGVTAAITGVLLWFLIGVVWAGQKELSAEVREHAVVTNKAIDRRDLFETDVRRLLGQIVRLDLLRCLNEAKVDSARQACVEATR